MYGNNCDCHCILALVECIKSDLPTTSKFNSKSNNFYDFILIKKITFTKVALLTFAYICIIRNKEMKTFLLRSYYKIFVHLKQTTRLKYLKTFIFRYILLTPFLFMYIQDLSIRYHLQDNKCVEKQWKSRTNTASFFEKRSSACRTES